MVRSFSLTQFQATVNQITASHQSSKYQRAYFDYMFCIANYLSQAVQLYSKKGQCKLLHTLSCKNGWKGNSSTQTLHFKRNHLHHVQYIKVCALTSIGKTILIVDPWLFQRARSPLLVRIYGNGYSSRSPLVSPKSQMVPYHFLLDPLTAKSLPV